MKAHKHAALMAEYAKDAAETEQPWRRWEVNGVSGKFRDCTEHPLWSNHMQYRRKVRTININGFEVPEPLREAPEVGTAFYVLNLSDPNNPTQLGWYPCYPKLGWLSLGMAHTSREAAEIHAKALLSFTTTKQ